LNTVYVIYILLVTDIMTEEMALRRLAFPNKEACYYWRDTVLKQQRDPIVNKMNCRSTIIYNPPN
jgi:hypothetical protein